MGLDIRIPIGLLLLINGLLLAGYGTFTEHLSVGVNINLWWGAVLLAAGAVLLYFGRRGTAK
jgi:hypothetical protein